MHPLFSLSTADIHQYMGKRKSVVGEGLSRAPKKKKPDVPVAAAAKQTDLPSVRDGLIDVPLVEVPTLVGEAVVALATPALAQNVSTGVSPSVEEQDDDVVIVKAPSIPVEPAILGAINARS